MGRHPCREWLLFTAAWLMVLIPVIRLTVDPPVRTDTPHERTEELEADVYPAWASVRFTVPPEFFRISQSGRELWSLDSLRETEADEEIMLHRAKGVAEIRIEVVWNQPGDQVVELTLAPDNDVEVQRHTWGQGRVEQILTYSWEKE